MLVQKGVLTSQELAQLAQPEVATSGEPPSKGANVPLEKRQTLAPYRGNLEAHQTAQKPLALLAGPIQVTITQNRDLQSAVMLCGQANQLAGWHIRG